MGWWWLAASALEIAALVLLITKAEWLDRILESPRPKPGRGLLRFRSRRGGR